MLNKSLTASALAIAYSLNAGVAQAALNDRGGGLLYDDVLNVTWLQDANYAKTSGYDADGAMNWTDATGWAAGLVYGGYDDWRLASNSPVNGSAWDYSVSYDGSTDWSWNITSPNSEMAYMYYINLGLKSYFDASGDVQPDWGVLGNGTPGGQADVGLVKNLQNYQYWSGIDSAQDSSQAWVFVPQGGGQGVNYKFYGFYAWAVRPGDVMAVPEPETYALMLAGLSLLGFTARRRKNQQA